MMPSPHNQERIRKITALVAAGVTVVQAAKDNGVKYSLVDWLRSKYRDFWRNCVAEAQAAYQGSAEQKRAQQIEEAAVPSKIRVGIQGACMLLAGGLTREQAAEKLRVTVHVLRDWKEKYPGIWRSQYDLAMQAPAVLQPRDPALQARALSHLQHWGEIRGQIALPHDGGMTLMGFLETQYRPLKLATASEATLRDYRSCIRALCCYAGRIVMVKDLTDEFIMGLLAWLIQRGRSADTANKHRATLLAIWRFAHKRKLLTTLPEVEKLRTEKRVPECWSPEEYGRILKAAALTPGFVGSIPACRWWCALLLTAYDSGVRIKALMQLRRDNLRAAEGWLRVPAEIQKQKADQVFKLDQGTIEALRKIERPGEALFPWPASRQTLGKHFTRICELAGVKCGGHSGLFHRIRKTTATYIADKLGKAAASAYLGHSCLSVTDRYIDPSKIHAIQGADVLPRPWLAAPTPAQPAK